MFKPYLFGPPGWVLRPGGNLAAADVDFANNRVFARGGSNSFSSVLSCARSSSADMAQGANGIWSTFAANKLRITDQGLLVEQSATNLATWCRDFTNAAWVKTTMTAALDQTGIDGAANSASSLTASGANATVLETPGLGIANRTFSVFIKRVTGSGTIKVTGDGITYSSDLSASLSTSAWYRASITANTVPVFGIQIGTSGDKIAVDFAQDETGTFATSPILTTSASATRAADSVMLIAAALSAVQSAAGWARVVTPFGINNAGTAALLSRQVTGGNDVVFQTNGSTVVRSLVNGSAFAAATIGASGTWASRVVAASTWDSTGIANAANGGTAATGATPFPTASSTDPFLGSRDGSIANTFVSNYISRLTLGTGRLSNAQLQALAA